MTDKGRLQDIKEGWNRYHLKTGDVEWLIEQAEKIEESEEVIYALQETLRQEQMVAEKAERYESALKTIVELTSCDDTWDFANRTLEGKEKIELPYRFNNA